MEEKKKRCCCRKSEPARKEAAAAEDSAVYPGVAVNDADDGKVDKNLVKERTATLNNNPRNND